jgi:hypothetical protein
MAGAKDVDLFSTKALATVWRRTAGFPRLINVCEQALVNAFGANTKRVDQELVGRARPGLDRPASHGPAATACVKPDPSDGGQPFVCGERRGAVSRIYDVLQRGASLEVSRRTFIAAGSNGGPSVDSVEEGFRRIV